MCENVEKHCRICLDVESDHVFILGDPTINLHMKSCLNVNVSHNDQLPKTICVACVSQLTQFYNFQLNARCSQDWLESSLQEKKKSIESKMPLQPLPDSEYNSDSLLEFLNNTANIEEYLNNLGKEDIPSIVNMLDKNEHEIKINSFKGKIPSPKKNTKTSKFDMEIDVLDSDIEIVKKILMKETDTKIKTNIPKIDKNINMCFACKTKFDNVQKMLQHMSICDYVSRTCIRCNMLFDSKIKMQFHSITHNTSLPLTCNCGKQFQTKEKLIQHHKTCHIDYGAVLGYTYRCKKCGDTFKERFQLYKHVKKHILKSEERICDICGHSFLGKDVLDKHKEEEHKKSADVLYRCKVCQQTFSDHKEIYLHVQKHVERPETSRHLCESCGRSFATLGTLMRHSLQHTDKGFKCSVCYKLFINEKARDNHLLEHVETVMCERCGQNVNNCKLESHSCV